MKYPKIRELREAIKALIKGPYTSRFPKEGHKPFERFRGRPYFHEEDCIGCGACFQVCPTRAISMDDVFKDGRARRKLTLRWDVCIFCGQCQANCVTEKGIVLSQEFDLATTGKREELKQSIEKDFVFCDCCAEPVLPYDQYAWVSKKLGPLVFSNASLLLFYLKSAGLALKEKLSSAVKKPVNRASRIKILCPACRREAVIKS
jgi:hydrogenase-4 component H